MAGDIWDSFDIASTVHATGVGGGDNSMMYTLPAMVDGLAMNVSYTPTGNGTDFDATINSPDNGTWLCKFTVF